MRKNAKKQLIWMIPILMLVWIVAITLTPNAPIHPNSAIEVMNRNGLHEEGAANKETSILPLLFSHQGGFYNNGFSLEITATAADATIYYTLDGSKPDTSSAVYDSPITIESRAGKPNEVADIPTTHHGWEKPGEVFKGTVVRAASYGKDGQQYTVMTHTYFVDDLGQHRYSLPVISISTDKENLFDDRVGIYVPGDLYRNDKPDAPWENPANYKQEGEEWEREIHLEFFEPDGTLGFSQDAGIRLHGNASRMHAIKSLRIYARKEYGKSKISYPVFPDQPVTEFKRLVLRNAGNDVDGAYLRDALMHSLVAPILDTQAYRPAVVFINGEYWGIHNIRERLDKYYLADKFGVAEDQVDLLEGNQAVVEGDNAHYAAMMNYISSHDMKEANHYEYMQQQMDTDNFIDYQISEIYFNNRDWPGNNIKYWREKTDYQADLPYGRDGRWRWLLYDTDFGFGMYGDKDYELNTLDFATTTQGEDWPNPPWSTFLLRKLLDNESFKQQFVNRFADHLNTTFHPDRVNAKVDEMEARLRPEMEEQIRRWKRPYSLSSWNDHLQRIRTFADMRPLYMRMHIISEFKLGGVAYLAIDLPDPSLGAVQVNKVMIEQKGTWQGQYFQDVPVELTAIARPGYVFTGWGGDFSQASATLQLTLPEKLTLTPMFVKEE